MSETRPVCAVVDAWSTGRFLYPGFTAAGWDVIHVRSRPEPPDGLKASFVDHPYLAVVRHEGDVAATAERVAAHRPRQLLAGSESGVLLADALGEALGLPGNGARSSPARRDKHRMAQALRAAGVPAVEDQIADRVEDAVAWAVTRDRWPVVVKPPDSSGTDNVVVCQDAVAVREAAELVLSSRNFADAPNQRVLVQGYLGGDEYIVNTVSWGGAHYFTDIWRCAKQRRGSAQIYDLEELLPFDGPEQAEIVPYVTSVLDALGVRFGPAHTELIHTDRGPILLEVGARLHGSFDPAPVAACVDHDHVAATLLAYTRPDEFQPLCGRPYRLRKRALCVMLVAPESGRLDGMPGDAAVRGLSSYFSTLMMVKVGGRIQSTVDLWTCPGMVYLVHPDRDVLEQDYRTIREMERGSLFAIAKA